eukprot:11261437-Karenia_brevis.AAC.1
MRYDTAAPPVFLLSLLGAGGPGAGVTFWDAAPGSPCRICSSFLPGILLWGKIYTAVLITVFYISPAWRRYRAVCFSHLMEIRPAV